MREDHFDVVALGELLIDFVGNGFSAQGHPLFEVNPGGAPCNVLAMLQKLGRKTAFIGKVGKDLFGNQLREAVENAGIDTRNLVEDASVRTTLAFVHTKPNGDRDFSFYRNPGADMMLRKDEVQKELIESARIFHFGTLSSTHDEVREATRYALDLAKKAGCICSFDPNLRPLLWQSLEDAKEEMRYGFSQADIVKISDDEVEFFCETNDYDKAAKFLADRYQISLLSVTLGKNGSLAYYHGMKAEAPGFLQRDTIETTGAGDTFCGCMLHYVLEHGLQGLTCEQLTEMLIDANAAGSVITTRRGALSVMPTRSEINALKHAYNRAL